MPTLMPTHAKGATAKHSDVVYVPPERRVDDEKLAQQLPDTGMNTPFIADFLSAALTHERDGHKLYRSVAQRTNNPVLKSRYEEFGRETAHHADVLEQLIREMGGDPMYVSPPARATHGADTKLIESTFLLAGSLDVMQQELAMLEAVVQAEAVDHSNWAAVRELGQAMPAGQWRDAVLRAADEVGPDEDEHLRWAAETKVEMIKLQAQGSTMAAAGAKAEELVATVKGWFS